MVAAEAALLSGFGKMAEKAVPGRGAATIAALGVASVGGGLKAFANVPTGHIGIRTRFDKGERVKGKREGERYGSVGPGMHWTVPFSDAIKIISVQEHNLELSQIKDEFPDADGTVVQREIGASITWAVKDNEESAYRSLFNPESPEALTRMVGDICTDGLRRVIKETRGAAEQEVDILFKALEDKVAVNLNKYGTELRALQLKETGRTLTDAIRSLGETGVSVLEELVRIERRPQ